MKTIIAGSRSFTNLFDALQLIDNIVFNDKLTITEVVSGTCKGPDKFGEFWANTWNIPIKPFPANWDQFGKSAGFRRNAQMADYGEQLIALYDGHSSGTKSMIQLATKKGLAVHLADLKQPLNTESNILNIYYLRAWLEYLTTKANFVSVEKYKQQTLIWANNIAGDKYKKYLFAALFDLITKSYPEVTQQEQPVSFFLGKDRLISFLSDYVAGLVNLNNKGVK